MRNNDRVKISLVFLMAMVAAGCKTTHPAATASSRIETIITVRDTVTFRDTVILVKIPSESETTVSINPDTSHVCTEIAESWAWVEGAFLHHTIANLPTHIPTTIKLPSSVHTESTTIISRDTITVIKETQRDFTTWQRLRLTMGDILLAAVAAVILYLCWKIARKFL